MIIPVDDDKAAAKLQESKAEADKSRPSSSEDPPPNYSDVAITEGGSQEGGTASGSGRRYTRLPPNLKPTNFVAQSRMNESQKGAWAIDPTMYIPPSLLPPLDAGQTEDQRPNLLLKGLNGGVDVDIYVLPVPVSEDEVAQTKLGQSKPGSNRRVKIQASTRNGAVTSRIREVTPTSSTTKRLPLDISLDSLNGRITVYLPREFEGPVRARTWNGSVKYSPSVEAELTRFSDMNGMQRSFIGRFEPSQWLQEPGSQWEGDEITLETRNGSVYIHFLDDLDLPVKPKTGFFSRLFG